MKLMKQSGQAVVELSIGLVAIMVLTGALVQIGRLAKAQSETMADARRYAGNLALSDSLPYMPGNCYYIYDWAPGPDRRHYTRDDVMVLADATPALRAILPELGSEGVVVPGNALSDLTRDFQVAESFALVRGVESEVVEVLPVVRRLVHAAGTVKVSNVVWMVWCEGLY